MDRNRRFFSMFFIYLLLATSSLSLHSQEYANEENYEEKFPGVVSFKDVTEEEMLRLFFNNDKKQAQEKMNSINREDMLRPTPQFIKQLETFFIGLKNEQEHFIKNFYDKEIGAKRILYLGDYPNYSRGSAGLSIKTAPLLPQTDVYMTDIQCPASPDEERAFLMQFTPFADYLSGHQNLKIRRLDHNGTFPFESGHFDAVLMDAGLCFCNAHYAVEGGHCKTSYDKNCGGISATAEAYEHFLSEVARVLNKKNPAAFALLEGMEYKTAKLDSGGEIIESLRLWEKAAAKVGKRNPELKFELLFIQAKNNSTGKTDRLFKGVRLTPRG